MLMINYYHAKEANNATHDNRDDVKKTLEQKIIVRVMIRMSLMLYSDINDNNATSDRMDKHARM